MTYSSTWRYTKDAYDWILGTIESRGDKVITEDGKLTKEVRNLMCTINEPGIGWPVRGSSWNLIGLNQYADQLLSNRNDSHFDYTYGERLFSYGFGETDQIVYVIEKLKDAPTSRRAIAITWVPTWDHLSNHVPCMQTLNFLYRDGKLHLTTFFRSWDAKRAALPNIYGLNKLNEYVAREVGVESGSLTVVAVSAHIYEE